MKKLLLCAALLSLNVGVVRSGTQVVNVNPKPSVPAVFCQKYTDALKKAQTALFACESNAGSATFCKRYTDVLEKARADLFACESNAGSATIKAGEIPDGSMAPVVKGMKMLQQGQFLLFQTKAFFHDRDWYELCAAESPWKLFSMSRRNTSPEKIANFIMNAYSTYQEQVSAAEKKIDAEIASDQTSAEQKNILKERKRQLVGDYRLIKDRIFDEAFKEMSPSYRKTLPDYSWWTDKDSF